MSEAQQEPAGDEAMVHEFDVLARWTADAVEELGSDYALPAGCRGSGSPEALRWIGRTMGLEAGTRLLDSGAGVGGPAGLAALEFGAMPTLVDPMVGACRAASRLFGLPVAVTSGDRLPFADATFDAAWSLGVLCTVDDQPALLRELVRVVRPGGAVGLLVYVRTVPVLSGQPEGNDFPTHDGLEQLVRDAGLTATHRAALEDFPGAADDWQAAVAAVDDVVDRDHGDDDRKRDADAQSSVMGDLIGSGQVAGRLLVARRP